MFGLWRMLERELKSLLSGREEQLRAAIGVKGSNDRVDALALLCREVLRSSSLCMIGGSVYHFDGRTYASCSLRRVLEVLGNLLMDAGASPPE